MYLAVERDEMESPVTDMRVVEDGHPVPDGFHKINTNLNYHGGGTSIFLCTRAVRCLWWCNGGRGL